jgi:hypothetical protein
MRGALLWIFAGVIALGQQDAGKKAKTATKPSTTDSAKVLQDFKVDAGEYVIRLASRPKEKLKLHEESLFHWGNPARTGEDGAVFVWMLDGRPEVIASVFTYRLPKAIRRKHEYHSLASGPLTAEYQGQRVWAPTVPGVTFQPVPDAPEPAATPRLRMSQMKAIARDFSARMVDAEGQKSDLRLIAQPLIRYEPKSKEVTDGALFSFSLGTDPEVILLLEARVPSGRAASRGPVWQYAFARFHYVSLTAAFKNKDVWHVEPLPDISTLEIGSPKYQDSVYATYHTATTPLEE